MSLSLLFVKLGASATGQNTGATDSTVETSERVSSQITLL